MRHRYPFEALHWLRHQRVEREAAALGERTAATARARSEERRAGAARQRTKQQIEALAVAERARLDEGSLRAGDLARQGEWRKGADAELQAKAELEQRAAAALRTEIAAESVARRALSAASGEAELIAAHESAWREQREVTRERAEEEAAVEQWTAKRYPPRA